MKKLLLLLIVLCVSITLTFASTKIRNNKTVLKKETIKKEAINNSKTLEICMTISKTVYWGSDSDGNEVAYTEWSLDYINMHCLFPLIF